MKQTINAKITETTLGYEDHGLFTYCLTLDFGGSFQGFVGGILDTNNADGERLGTAWGHENIIRILRTVGVDNWEELRGKHVRAVKEDGLIVGIGNILTDDWFYPKQLAEEMEIPIPRV